MARYTWLMWGVALTAFTTSCSSPPESAKDQPPRVVIEPLNAPADAAEEDWHWVNVGGCQNPSNVPDDKELNAQHDDFLSFLHHHGVASVSAGSVGVSFGIRSDQVDKANKLIADALEKNPTRWSRLDLKTK